MLLYAHPIAVTTLLPRLRALRRPGLCQSRSERDLRGARDCKQPCDRQRRFHCNYKAFQPACKLDSGRPGDRASSRRSTGPTPRPSPQRHGAFNSDCHDLGGPFCEPGAHGGPRCLLAARSVCGTCGVAAGRRRRGCCTACVPLMRQWYCPILDSAGSAACGRDKPPTHPPLQQRTMAACAPTARAAATPPPRGLAARPAPPTRSVSGARAPLRRLRAAEGVHI